MITEVIDVKSNIDYAIKKTITALVNGDVIAFPTDTVYGFGVDSTRKDSIAKLYELKQRELNNPIGAYFYDIGKVALICDNIPDLYYVLADKFFPGPLTIILNKKKEANIVIGNSNSVAIRVPDNKFLLMLLKEFDGIIAGTSANLSGKPPSIESYQLINDFSGKIPLILDDGKCKYSIESTVISLVDNNIRILRNGVIKKNEIEKVLNFKL